MGIAAEILENLAGTAEGGLGIDNPFGVAEGSQVAEKVAGLAQVFQFAEETQLSGGIGPLKGFEKKTAEKAAEDADGEEEAGRAGDPLAACGETAAGDDAMQVRMQVEILTPSVEDGEEAGLHTEVLGVAGDSE
jgi:hypothetical protein